MVTIAANPRTRAGRIAHHQPLDILPPRIRLNRTAVIRGFTARLIVQAIDDLKAWESSRDSDPRKQRAIGRNAVAALQWLNGMSDQSGATFAECCDILEFNAAESCRRILALVHPAALEALRELLAPAVAPSPFI